MHEDSFMEPTNDLNEGTLGSLRKTLHHNPSMTLDIFNARTMVKRSKTVPYMVQSFTQSDRRNLRGLGRAQNSSQRESTRRLQHAKSEQQDVRDKRLRDQESLAKKKAYTDKLASILYSLPLRNSRMLA